MGISRYLHMEIERIYFLAVEHFNLDVRESLNLVETQSCGDGRNVVGEGIVTYFLNDSTLIFKGDLDLQRTGGVER